MPVAYVIQLGQTGLFKVGKTDDLSKRQSTYDTISTEERIVYAAIETANKAAVETFIKHRLQHRRWFELPGKELYRVTEDELRPVVEAAERFNGEQLPKMAEAERLGKLQCEGSIIDADELSRDLHRELVRWRQQELTAQQEMERIKTELKLLTRTAPGIKGVATWRNQSKVTFDEPRLKNEQPKVYEAYYTRVTPTRPFVPNW